jgi:acyl carrier protein
MDQDAVMARLSDLFREVFDDPGLLIGPSTSAADIAGWDAMTHITLIVAIEQAFSIRFRTSEMDGLHDVGELAALVTAKRAVTAV